MNILFVKDPSHAIGSPAGYRHGRLENCLLFSFIAHSRIQCAEKCSDNPECVSMNMQKISSREHTCELNNGISGDPACEFNTGMDNYLHYSVF